MAHAREVIRKAVVTAVTGLATTGTEVVNWALHAQGEDCVPYLSVEVAADPEVVSESVDNEYGTTEVRDLPVTIRAHAVQVTSSTRVALLDTIDDICAEVEAAIGADFTLGGAALDARLLSTEINMDGGGELPVATATMEWQVRYSVNRADPTA